MIESVQKQMEQCLVTLEAGSAASWEDIEKQYRHLIQRWHPDRNSGENSELAQSKFIEINSAYKAIREQYRKNGAIPRPIPSDQRGPLLGTKKEVVIKPAFYKNKLVIAAILCIALLTMFGALLWSLDSRVVENNRDRAKVEKSSTVSKAKIQTTALETAQNSTIIKQSATELEP